MQNKKIQLWALSMAGYNCTVEYIAGTENTCADLLSRKPDGGHAKAKAKPFEVDINDNTFEIGVINSKKLTLNNLQAMRSLVTLKRRRQLGT